ncbi:uncharacterized protein LOC124137567 [Haliotis rufescens]|uniref:uncharacterized protein LOC124137567 n=1 Tax=Haliotis rufescens TaxID=6454 RepID=UPI00201E9677|nr:uncharacterized protein LOC124137567 [Haliotis rufescens]
MSWYVPSVCSSRAFCRICFLSVVVHAVSTVKKYDMGTMCGDRLDLEVPGLENVEITNNVAVDLRRDCDLTVLAPSGKMLMATFTSIEFTPGPFCEAVGHVTLNGERCRTRFPVTNVPRFFRRVDLSISFRPGGSRDGPRFNLLLTAFSNAPCFSRDYTCSNNVCISRRLLGNGLDNCGDGTLQVNDDSKTPVPIWVLAVFIVIAVLTVVIVAVCVIRWRRKRQDDASAIQTISFTNENFRVSRSLIET